MISPLAIRKFLNRPLRDSALAKRLSEKVIDRKIANLPVSPRWKTQPKYLHQKVSFLLAAKRKRYLIFLDPGTGKSWISLAVFRYATRLHQAGLGNRPRALVLVPGTSNVGQWVDECAKHCPQYVVQPVNAVGPENRALQVFGEADIVVITYAGFLALSCSGKVTEDESGAAVAKGWKLDDKKLKQFCNHFNFFIGDESTAFRTRSSLTARACKKVSWACEWAYALTGTPFGTDPIHLWSQFYVIDKGTTLGETLGLFREALFTKKPHFWAGWIFEFDKRKKKILNRMLAHNSIRYLDRECLDIPPAIPIIRPVTFCEENWRYYDRLAEEVRKARGDVAEVTNSFMRLRQICAGYISAKGSNGDTIEIRFKQNPKLDALMQLLEEIGPDKKVVVFHEYKITGQLICDALKKAKIKYLWLYSGTRRADKENIASRFADPKVRVLVSSSAGAFGLNLQISHNFIWAERPIDPLLWKQEKKRGDRIGQTKTVRLFDLAIKGSIDEKIIESHASNENLFKAVVDGRLDLRRNKGG